jgi:hypothetical protein
VLRLPDERGASNAEVLRAQDDAMKICRFPNIVAAFRPPAVE